jgi:hypothetical protein
MSPETAALVAEGVVVALVSYGIGALIGQWWRGD